jgi:hypothetical protein
MIVPVNLIYSSAGSNKVYIKNMVRITDGTESEIKFLANVIFNNYR